MERAILTNVILLDCLTRYNIDMKRIGFILGLCCCAAGIYVLAIVTAPLFWPFPTNSVATNGTAGQNDSQPTLEIPALGLSEPIFTGDESMLDKGVWLKFADRSNPELGGNTVIVGHRFNFGLTPGETKRKSPFFHIDTIQIGDKIYVAWKGKRYTYTVSKLFTVSPHAVEIEENTEQAQLTIYTCTLKGEYDGRKVLIAKPDII